LAGDNDFSSLRRNQRRRRKVHAAIVPFYAAVTGLAICRSKEITAFLDFFELLLQGRNRRPDAEGNIGSDSVQIRAASGIRSTGIRGILQVDHICNGGIYQTLSAGDQTNVSLESCTSSRTADQFNTRWSELGASGAPLIKALPSGCG
jgi:hypothetical protein